MRDGVRWSSTWTRWPPSPQERSSSSRVTSTGYIEPARPTFDLQLSVSVVELADPERQLVGELLARSLTEDQLRVTNPGAVELVSIVDARPAWPPTRARTY